MACETMADTGFAHKVDLANLVEGLQIKSLYYIFGCDYTG